MKLERVNDAKRFRAVYLVCALLLYLSGCANTGPVIQSPAVVLQGIELQDFDFRQQKFRLHFNVDNPNPFPLPISSVRYKVFLERMQFAGGETGGSFTVPANGATEFDVSVELDLMRSATNLATLLRTGASRPLAYELQGSLAVKIPFTKPLTFTREGTIVVQ